MQKFWIKRAWPVYSHDTFVLFIESTGKHYYDRVAPGILIGIAPGSVCPTRPKNDSWYATKIFPQNALLVKIPYPRKSDIVPFPNWMKVQGISLQYSMTRALRIKEVKASPLSFSSNHLAKDHHLAIRVKGSQKFTSDQLYQGSQHIFLLAMRPSRLASKVSSRATPF